MSAKTKKKFYFNPDTTKYEEIRITISYRLRKLLYHLLSGIALGIAFFFLFVSIIKSPKEKEIAMEKNRIEGQYKVLQGQINEMQGVLIDLQKRDNNLYRVIFQAEPVPSEAWKLASNNIEYYDQLLEMTNSQILVETTQRVNQLRKQVYTQSKSFDEVARLAMTQEEMLKCIPAIQPVPNKDLSMVASGWGYRMDPILHTSRFHQGMDFSAPIGTDVFATGNGKVISAGWERGHGNCVRIDHGYGYATFYAHLSSVYAYIGKAVTRGEVIGKVGNTGKSYGPHLHYEVHQKGKPVNPLNFYFLDLTSDEYDRMLQLSTNSGLLLD